VKRARAAISGYLTLPKNRTPITIGARMEAQEVREKALYDALLVAQLIAEA
jgi:hypothetical protein